MPHRLKFSTSGALLQGKLFDDKGNRMSPSFSSKNGVRYRFYVSTAALRGRMQKAGSVTRISAPEIEGLVEAALSEQLQGSKEAMLKQVKMITVSDGIIRLTLMQAKGKPRPIQIPWASKPKGGTQVIAASEAKLDQKLVKSIIRTRARLARRPV